jgi:hypothetical protein
MSKSTVEGERFGLSLRSRERKAKSDKTDVKGVVKLDTDKLSDGLGKGLEHRQQGAGRSAQEKGFGGCTKVGVGVEDGRIGQVIKLSSK